MLSSYFQLQRMIPDAWRENIGSDIYQQYTKLRLKMLKGEVGRTKGPSSIEYVKVEQGKKQRLLFLPGFADCKENFFDAAQALVQDFDLLIPDLPGFGNSFRSTDCVYNIPQYGQWMSDFVRETGWDDFHLLGNSLGGATAIELALRLPERVRSLTLIDPAGVALAELPSVYHEFVQGRNVFDVRTQAQFDYFLQRVFHRPPLIPPLVRDHLFRQFERNGKWYRKVLGDLLDGVLDFEDPRFADVALNSKLPRLKLPTLIVWGDEDSFFPAETGFYMQQLMPHARLYILADRGHSPQIEAPWQFVKLFKKFIRRQAERPTFDRSA